MAELLEVPTHFADVNGLVQYLALRVKNEALWLAASRNLGSGDWVRFIIRLSDGQSVLEGVGRCTTSTPNLATDGVFDVVLDALQFDPRNEIMFERILIASETLSSGKEGTRPISLSEVDIAVAGVPVDGSSYHYDVDLDDEAPMPLSPLSIKNKSSKNTSSKNTSVKKATPDTASSAPPPLPGSRAPGRMRPAVKGRAAIKGKPIGERPRRRSSQELPKAPVRPSRRTEALGSAEDPVAKKKRLADEHRKRSERFERMQREKREAEKREREEQRRQLQEAKRERERELAELKRERERKKAERDARRRSRPSQAKRASERNIAAAAPIKPEITRSGKKTRPSKERAREEAPPTYETPSHAPGRFAPDEFDLEATQVGTALEDIEAMRQSPFPQTEPPAPKPTKPAPEPTSAPRAEAEPAPEPAPTPRRKGGTDTSVALPTQPEEEVMLSLELDQKLDHIFHVLQERGVVATREDALILALKIGLGALSAEYE